MTSPIRDGLALLRSPDFARLFAAYLITHTGSAMAPIAMAFGVLELTGSTRATAWVVAAPVVAQVLILLVGGAVADRGSRRRLLVRADLVSMLSQATVAALFLLDAASVPWLVGLVFVNGAAFSFHQPAAVGFIPEVVSGSELRAANALLGTARSSAWMIGAALAGMLVAIIGPGPTLAVDAVSFGIAAWLIAGIRSTRATGATGASDFASSAPRASLATDLRVGFTEFTSHQWLWTIVLQFSVLIMGVEALFGLVGPATARDVLAGPPDWGLVMACFGAGTIAGGGLTLRLRIERPMFVATCLIFLWAPLPLLLIGPAPVAILALAAFVQGVAAQIFSVLWYTTLQTEIPADRLSRVSAYDHFGSVALAPIGVVIAGILYESIGRAQTLLAIAATIVVPTLLVLFVPGVRRLRSRSGT